ncbi:MAG: hypothetical protein A3K19_26520 [Lentisphaerae bacterium RIFOXYB12_FULL_65_16]|nr:MAG: hypothetical protein A3K18_21175 [Lentisphaerae bacterium RIFOXYA12_64_32]OGV94995.1 MAG: hypothetical protein A3K19_26520 [Lentisphaerae bacterium RIFOXYB12_FULL_65_16]
MVEPKPANLAASVHQRLLNLARRERLDTGTSLAEVVGLLALFLGPVTDALVRGDNYSGHDWPPGGPWRRPRGR